MNLSEACRLVHHVVETNPRQAMMLWGPPGVGKSSLVRQLGLEHGIPVIEMRTSQMDPVDVKGIPTVDNGRTVFCPPDELPDAERDGERGILSLSEINAGTRATMASMMQLVLDRKLGTYRLPEGWLVIADGNRTTDKAVANAMPSALNNRFMHFHVEPDLDTTIEYGLAKNWPVEILQFLRFRPELLHAMNTQTDMDAFPSPRSWEFVVDSRVLEMRDPHLRRQALLSCIGQAAMIELEGFIQTFVDGSLPSIEDILLNPLTAALPTEMTAKYAVIAVLIKRADAGTIDAIVQYINRFEEKEFSVMGMKDILRNKPELNNTKATVAWVTQNQEYLS